MFPECKDYSIPRPTFFPLSPTRVKRTHVYPVYYYYDIWFHPRAFRRIQLSPSLSCSLYYSS